MVEKILIDLGGRGATRIRVEHVVLLKFEEKKLALAEEHLLHQSKPFHKVQEIDDVQVSFQLFLAQFLEVIVATTLDLSKALTPYEAKALAQVLDQVFGAILEHPLIYDQMVDGEELLTCRPLANQLCLDFLDLVDKELSLVD